MTNEFNNYVGFTLREGSPSKNTRRPRSSHGRRGGLEIVFNQQLTRLGYYLTSCVIAPSAKIILLFHITLLMKYLLTNPFSYFTDFCNIKFMSWEYRQLTASFITLSKVSLEGGGPKHRW
ncbi:hypothetical protein RND81_14G209600 [Saponaria officinalis]|uniref:Uncharacterized protein n=1 Tax=Saponaria officinalis TaxID=3572 RepID=A0AAW1GV15_SAPOF